MKPKQILSMLLVFTFTATSIPTGTVPFGDSPNYELAPQSRLAQTANTFSAKQYLAGKVVAIQGIGGTGGLLIKPLLEAGAIVIASDVDPERIGLREEEFAPFINSKKLFIFQETRDGGGSYTQRIMNPLKAFPDELRAMGVDHIDVFSPCAVGPVLNPDTINELKEAGVRVVCGSCNNVSVDKEREPRLLKEAGIIYVPDYIANAGGVTGVDGHLGHDVSDAAVTARIAENVEGIVARAYQKGLTTQRVADATSREFFEALDTSGTVNPKQLDGITLEDGSRVKVLVRKEDYPQKVLKHWDNHYAVFEIRNDKLGYVAYMAIHRFTKIKSKAAIIDGQYRATGGTRIRNYTSNDEALADALELAQEMSFKNAGAKLAIGGSKCTINVAITPNRSGKDAEAREKVLISYAKAIEEIGRLIGGGVLTGQDVNIAVADAKLLFKYAPTSIVPYVAPGLSIAPTPPTGVGVFSAMATAMKLSDNLSWHDEALYKEICGVISRIAAQVISLEKDPKELTKAITDAVLRKTPEQFSKRAPRLVNFLAKKYEEYDPNNETYGPNAARVRLGIISGFSKIGEKAAEAQLEPIVSSIIEILSSVLKSDDETGWLSETSAEALGEIGETLMLSKLEGREDIAKRITVILRNYITSERSWNAFATEATIRALGKIGIREEETVSILQEFTEDFGSVLQEPAQVALQQLGVVGLGIALREAGRSP